MDINKIINEILKDVSEYELIMKYEDVIKVIISILLSISDYKDLNKEQEIEFIKDSLFNINIRGKDLSTLKKLHQKYNNGNMNFEKSYNNNYMKKTVYIVINGNEIPLEVYDTGNTYIPVNDDVVYSSEVLEQLKILKENDRIKQLADMIENGTASIYLNNDDRDKINDELDKRRKNREHLEKTM